VEPNWIGKIKKVLDEECVNSSDFDLNQNIVLPSDRKLNKAAVLLGICFSEKKQPSVLLTKRAGHLKNHPGQIAFPGGKFESEDRTLVNTALREAEEEIGLNQSIPQKLGILPKHETITKFLVTPIIFQLPYKLDLKIDKNEVDEVFYVPLEHFLTLDNYRIQARKWQEELRYYYVVPYGPYYIWGATARILYGFAEGFKNAYK
tara:strand:+ start:1043 stop:1654 length:612 start_codon:yes stop_codon:yes gene_type:complete